jgi:hypothetical protein
MEVDHLIIALDISLSMRAYIGVAVSGLNTFVQKLKRTDPNVWVTVVKFNDSWAPVIDTTISADLPVFTAEHFYCCGTTSLYDFAYNYILNGAKEQDPQTQTRTHFYVISDGDDNTSKVYKAENLATICKYANESCGWYITHCSVDDCEILEHTNHVRYDIDNIEDLLSGLGI